MCFGPSQSPGMNFIPPAAAAPAADLTTTFSVTSQQLEQEIAALRNQSLSRRNQHPTLRARIQAQIRQKQTLLDSLRHPTSSIPSAPAAPATYGARIEPARVGVNDLKIPLPSY